MISPIILVILIPLLTESFGTEYIVGDSFWSIPTTNDFYNSWSSSHFFQIGDALYFDFDSGLHNLMQVSGREYVGCTATHPFKAFWDGPATIVLVEEGVFYFICSIANYCALGQKLSVVVHRDNNSRSSSPGHSHSNPLSSSSSELASPPMPPPPPQDGTLYSSQPPDAKMIWSISPVSDSRSGGDQCHRGVPLGWFAALYIVSYVVCFRVI